MSETKEELRSHLLKPKTELMKLRKGSKLTTEEIASKVGLSRRQYELKENGKYPFNDYEMLILARFFGKNVQDIFFER